MGHIDLYTFFLLCHLEHINIIYILNKCFYSTYDIDNEYIDIINTYLHTSVKINETSTTTIHNITKTVVEPEVEAGSDTDTAESELSDIDEDYIDSKQSVTIIPVLTKENNGKYYLKHMNSSGIKWNTLCKIDKLHQPIPPISYFTVPRLQNIYGKIYNTMPINKKKQEMYNEIKEVVKLI